MIPDVPSIKSSDVVDSIVCVVKVILVVLMEELPSNTKEKTFRLSSTYIDSL